MHQVHPRSLTPKRWWVAGFRPRAAVHSRIATGGRNDRSHSRSTARLRTYDPAHRALPPPNKIKGVSHDPMGNFSFFGPGHAGAETGGIHRRSSTAGFPAVAARLVPSVARFHGRQHPSDDLRRLPRGGIIGSSSGARFLGHHHPSEHLRRSKRAQDSLRDGLPFRHIYGRITPTESFAKRE